VIGSVVTAVYRIGMADATTSLDPEDASRAADGITGASDVASSLSASAGPALLEASRAAWLTGMNVGVVLIALVMAAVAALALVFLRGVQSYRVSSEPADSGADLAAERA
jgi:DHA2 family multidrug resistance protein-like MFS transporter